MQWAIALASFRSFLIRMVLVTARSRQDDANRGDASARSPLRAMRRWNRLKPHSLEGKAKLL